MVKTNFDKMETSTFLEIFTCKFTFFEGFVHARVTIGTCAVSRFEIGGHDNKQRFALI
jgi:hypothetical protein